MEEISEQSTKLANKKRAMSDFAKEIKIKSKQNTKTKAELLIKKEKFEALIVKNRRGTIPSLKASNISSNLGDLKNKIETLEDRRTKEERGMEKSILIPFAKPYNSTMDEDHLGFLVGVIFFLVIITWFPLSETSRMGFECDNGDLVDMIDFDDGYKD
ncbi:uncharacterized protein METZ01_LOCUS338476, partial [marine metagenome]